MSELIFSVSDFVAVFNQSVEYAYPSVTITGELANFRVRKNRWVYFDLKDESSILRFFGLVYQLPGPLENGMLLQVRGAPRLHPQYGFSVTVTHIQPSGEGSIKKAAILLQAKLAKEGLFDIDRKRLIPYPPKSIGLVTSEGSAAFHDFMKVIDARWGGITIILYDVQVQGEIAVGQIIEAISKFNQQADPPDVIVITRGGGSAEDMQVFNTEQVTRAVAASRIPTLVAIGHEIDVSLAELAADQRASTPSNAAELLVPDRNALLGELEFYREQLWRIISGIFDQTHQHLLRQRGVLDMAVNQQVTYAKQQFVLKRQLLHAFDPQAALRRGYAMVLMSGTIVHSGTVLKLGDILTIQLVDAEITAETKKIRMRDLYG